MPEHTTFFSYLIARFPALGHNMHVFGTSLFGQKVGVHGAEPLVASFFVMLMLTTLRRIELHPINYFFLAAAFFAFHLLLAYLVDHISIHAAFLIASAVSTGLVVSYLRLAVGTQFALREAGIAQFIYLILFSYAFFFKGFTGLAIAVGAILTLFVSMQLTGRVRWTERLAGELQVADAAR